MTLSCFTEIGCLIVDSEYDSKFVHIFHGVMEALAKVIPYSSSLDFVQYFADASDHDQKFIQNFALFITSILSNHIKVRRKEREGGEGEGERRWWCGF